MENKQLKLKINAPTNKHKWQFGTCVNCGCIREVVKIGNRFITTYYSYSGMPFAKRPECSGQIKSTAKI